MGPSLSQPEGDPVIVVVEAVSAAGFLVHLGLLWWFHERYTGTAVWPVMAAKALVVLSGLGFSAIAAGAAAPGLWPAWQAAVLLGSGCTWAAGTLGPADRNGADRYSASRLFADRS